MIHTPYVPHLYGDAAQAKLKSHVGWLTIGVASSIPWPQEDVWVSYDGHEYVFRGSKAEKDGGSPCISTPCSPNEIDSAKTRCYLLCSVLGWFKGGYVDVTGSVWGSTPIRYGSRHTFSTVSEGVRFFTCNYMPVIRDERTRKALAFLREGRRLRHVHEPYSFLSFFKVLESQFNTTDRVNWIKSSIGYLERDAAKRVKALEDLGVNVSNHLYESGRCAVAHASLDGAIVDPDIPADRRRIADDIEVIAALANRYISAEAGVPDDRELYKSRDRTVPWHGFLPPETLRRLQAGDGVDNLEALGGLQGVEVSVRLWGSDPPECMQKMRLRPEGYGPGLILFSAISRRNTLVLCFLVDFANGRIHTQLEDGMLTDTFNQVSESEVEHYTRYVHSVIGNSLVELCIEGIDPIPCEVVIPRNIIPQPPEEMVAKALDEFRNRPSKEVAVGSAVGARTAQHAAVRTTSEGSAGSN